MLDPPPAPLKMAEALATLAEKVPKLLDLVPQLSVPRMVLGMLDTLIDFLSGVRDELQAILAQAVRTAAARARAEELGDASLAHIAACAQAGAQAQVEAMASALGPMSTLTGTLDLFLSILGLPGVPALDGLIDPEAPEAAFAAIEAVIDVLESIRGAVPLP